jgi:hypothetical protein
MKRYDPYVEILKLGKKHLFEGSTGFTRKQLEDELKVIGLKNSELSNLGAILDSSFVMFVNNGTSAGQFYRMKTQGLEYLIDYEEMQEVRGSSRQATWFAIISIIITLAALITSIYFSKLQLENSLEIDQKQYETLMEKIPKLEKSVTINQEQYNKLLNEIRKMSKGFSIKAKPKQ